MNESTHKPHPRGQFIMIDGIDGSGKSTIMSAWSDYLASTGKQIFSLKEYWHTHGTHPTPTDAINADVIISAEPTYVWTGKAIREELIATENDYTATSIAAAYALDRLVLYKRFLLPLLEMGKTIIQDRGISTSLCYQSIDSPLTMGDIATIEGNAVALNFAPNTLVLTHIDPRVALSRLDERSDKQDNAMFERQSFLESAHHTFHSEAFASYFTSRGTQIHVLDTNKSVEEMKDTAIALLQKIQ